jgi:hypothetical protein
MQKTRATELHEKLDEVQATVDASKKKWEQLHSRMKLARDKEFSQMSDQHAQQISSLEQLFKEEPPPEIRKYSAALLQLRRREQAMLQVKQYAVAASIKKQADELQSMEDERQLQQWHARINDRIRSCRVRQQRQANGRKSYWKTEEQKMIREAELEIAIAEKQIEHLRANIEMKLNAKRAATALKQIDRDFQNLPTLNGKDSKQEFRQRQILTTKMYTRTQSRHRSETPRKRTA